MQEDYIIQLIKSAQLGKKEAFEELCNLNLKKIYNLSVRIVLNGKIAEIITRYIYRSLGKFRIPHRGRGF